MVEIYVKTEAANFQGFFRVLFGKDDLVQWFRN